MPEHLMSSATLQDIIRRLKTQQKLIPLDFPEVAAIQLNDTHPTTMVAELLCILIGIEGLDFQIAYNITTKVFSYICHTLMPEALEKWPLPLFENLLPRHLQIVYEFNQHFLNLVCFQFAPGDKVISALSIAEDSTPKQLRMANLTEIGIHTVNGVANVSSDLMKKNVSKEFATLWPGRFQNTTNGVRAAHAIRK
jgi:starch phosphorylase